MRPRPTVRLRLAVLYTSLFLLAGGLLLGVSYTLLDGHLHRTLSESVADGVLTEIREQYALALLAVTALAFLLGWLAAGHVLGPLRDIVGAARAVSGESLHRRIAASGPDDELRELAETFDEMLDRLEAAFTSQRRFVANASHELRTPLTVMRTELEVALADPQATGEDLRRAADVVREEVLRCQALIDGLLSLARTEAGVMDRTERVDLREVVRSAVERSGEAVAARGLSVNLALDPVAVTGDPRLLEQLVWNLVENAVVHNHDGGFVEIAAAAAGPELIVSVENSGPRVPPEATASLLEPFQRLGRPGLGGPGAGVGLSIVRAVAAAHGGSVRLSARREGGLRVEVRLPASVRSERDQRAAGARARGSRGRPSSAPRRSRPGSSPGSAPR